MKDSIIIVSGGLDSITLLYDKAATIALAVSFDYGQNHASRELPFAALHCKRLGIQHIVIPLQFMQQYFKSSLLDGAENIPEGQVYCCAISERYYACNSCRNSRKPQSQSYLHCQSWRRSHHLSRLSP